MKKLIITTCITAAVSLGIYLYACTSSEEDWEGFYYSIFSPHATVNKEEYAPLFLDKRYFFYGNESIKNDGINFRDNDLADWKKYLGKNLSNDAIAYFMYDDDALNEIEKYNAATDKNKVNLSHKVLQKNDKAVANFFSLLGIARGNEKVTNVKYDYWNYDESAAKEYTQNSEIEKAEKLYQKATADNDAFFANRMWLQVMRLKFYSNNRSAAISFFNETQNSQPKNGIYYRGLHYVAGAYKAQKDYQKANAALAVLFNTNYPFKQAATYEYRPLPDNETKKIASTLSTDEQCALWAIQGFYSEEENAIQKILSINPKSPHIDFLLTRYIKNIEAKTNEVSFKTIADYHQQCKKIVTNEFKTDWVIQTAKKGNVSNPFLWNVVAGYIQAYKQNYQDAKNFLQKAEEQTNIPNQKEQVHQIRLFNEVYALSKITKEDENRLLKLLMWTKSPQDTESYYQYLTPFIKEYLSKLYQENGNALMSELTLHSSSYFIKPEQAAAMEQFLLKTNKNDWEKYWESLYTFSLADIYESRAIFAFFNNNIEEAITQMEKIPYSKKFDEETQKWVTTKEKKSEALLPANPFNGFIADCHDCEHAKKIRNPYSKISFLKKVKEMQEKVDNGEDVYNNALLLGNAFYNCSYFGNNRFFYYNDILGEYSSLGVNEENRTILLSMDMAKKYYLIAQKHTANDEQRAKIAYMLAKVERNEFYNQKYFYDGRWYGGGFKDPMFKDWNGFKELRKYPHTKYYKEVLRECEYFEKVKNRK